MSSCSPRRPASSCRTTATTGSAGGLCAERRVGTCAYLRARADSGQKFEQRAKALKLAPEHAEDTHVAPFHLLRHETRAFAARALAALAVFCTIAVVLLAGSAGQIANAEAKKDRRGPRNSVGNTVVQAGRRRCRSRSRRERERQRERQRQRLGPAAAAEASGTRRSPSEPATAAHRTDTRTHARARSRLRPGTTATATATAASPTRQRHPEPTGAGGKGNTADPEPAPSGQHSRRPLRRSTPVSTGTPPVDASIRRRPCTLGRETGTQGGANPTRTQPTSPPAGRRQQPDLHPTNPGQVAGVGGTEAQFQPAPAAGAGAFEQVGRGAERRRRQRESERPPRASGRGQGDQAGPADHPRRSRTS